MLIEAYAYVGRLDVWHHYTVCQITEPASFEWHDISQHEIRSVERVGLSAQCYEFKDKPVRLHIADRCVQFPVFKMFEVKHLWTIPII